MLSHDNIELALKENEEIAVCTSGVSMYPMLRHRKDMAVIKSVNYELKKNDVALYRAKSGKLILHRIIKVTPEVYVIRGDNLYSKEYVKKQDVFGCLKGFNRNGKYIDCEKSRGYKAYIMYVNLSFPLRYLVLGILRPSLIKIRSFFKEKINFKKS